MKRLLVLALAITGILAAGCIVRFGTFNDDTNHFVGLASNLTNVDVVAASVQVDFLNSSGSVVYTRNVSPCTRTLQKHMDSPVEATAPSSINARTTKETVKPLTFGHKTVADLDVDEDIIGITTTADEKETHITGSIDANEDLENVHVCAALFDNDGNVIAVGHDFSTTPGDIDDNDTGTFDVSVDTGDIDVGDIDQYELWFDAIAGNNVTAPVVVGPNDVSGAVHNTGLLSPGAAAALGDFANPDNALTSNDVYATAVTTAGAAKTHVFIDYPLDAADIPNSANIEGIGVRVDWKIDATTSDNSQIKVELSWDGGTSWTAAKTSTELSTTEETVILGGSSEDWGHNWDVDELTDANFRVRITADSDAAHTFYFDWIPVTIYYTD
jgi:hypothetical protein